MKKAGWNSALVIGAAFIFFLGEPVHAEDARVLPKGRSRFSLTFGRASGVSSVFDSQGHVEKVTAPYNFELNSTNLQTFNHEFSKLVNYLNSMPFSYDESRRNEYNHGVVKKNDDLPSLGEALSRGFLGVDASAVREQYLLSYQYGVTDRLSMGLMVPYIKTIVDVNYGLSGDNTAQDIYDGLKTQGSSSDYDQNMDDLSSVSGETFQSLVENAGYDRISDFNQTGFGDLVLGGRFNYLNREFKGSSTAISSVQLGITAPTGRLTSPRNLTAVDFGQGAWDFNLANIVNYSPSPKLTFSQGLHYTHRFKTTRKKIVRTSPDELLPDASEEETVGHQMGDKFWATVGAKYNFGSLLKIQPFDLTLDTNYEFYWKGQDEFWGKNKEKDYSYLSEAVGSAGSYLETLHVGLSLTTINAFLQYKFILPMEFSLNAYIPTRGRNSIVAAFAVAELALYF